MEERKLKYNKSKAAAWLIKIALSFSVFAFSGYHDNLYLAFQEVAKTELFFSRKTTSTNKILSIGKYLTFSRILLVSKKDHKFAVLNYNQISNTAFKTLKQTFLSYKCSLPTLQYKANLPQSYAGEDFPYLTIG